MINHTQYPPHSLLAMLSSSSADDALAVSTLLLRMQKRHNEFSIYSPGRQENCNTDINLHLGDSEPERPQSDSE